MSRGDLKVTEGGLLNLFFLGLLSASEGVPM